MKQLISIALIFLLGLTLYQCNPDRNYYTDEDAALFFSMDTVYFDTVFTTIGTSTHSFKLYNPYNRFIKIDEIALAGGENSFFRINVDGQSGTVFENFEIAPEDSMYVFVEATLGSNEVSNVLRIQDSVTFKLNGNLHDVDLMAWGQDVHILRDSVLNPNAEWTADKPYLILDAILIDSLQTLKIESGTRIYMHSNARIYVLGSIEINGTRDNPVLIQGDRLEEFYQDKPGQWGYIWIVNGSVGNKVSNAMIKGGTIGFFVNSSLYDTDSILTIRNTEINYMSHDGILAQGSSVAAENLVIGNCGNSCVELIWSGKYSFTHCTLANYWPSIYSNRTSSALKIENYLNLENNEIYPGDIHKASFRNCIISGNNINELDLKKSDQGLFNYEFKNCLTKINTDVLNFVRDPNFRNIVNNENPLFAKDTLNDVLIYELDSLSPAIDMGFIEYANEVLRDKNGNVRTLDGKPDVGAFEWQPSSE